MKRGYTALEYKSIIRRLRRVRPDILISSDFIVGFPGETDKDFEKTMQLVEEVNFDFSYSFLYSRRPGTPAATLRDDTPLAEKKARLSRLQAVLEAHGRRFSEAMVGSVQTVLVEGESKRGEGLCGRTANNRVVNFAADADAVGSLLPLRILESTPHSLRGEVVATASSH
jgi:tRNA-2-methylthio-N6-dimethylallyladenosine synthase